MADGSGNWTTYGERLVYDNRWVRVGLVDALAPDGRRAEHHVVHLDRIAIAVLLEQHGEQHGERAGGLDRVLMLWRHRFATGQWGYELPGGLVDAGEEPAAAAAREAVEESGWQPLGEPDHLLSFEPLPGQLTAPIDVYLWQRAVQVGEPSDTEEAGRLEWVPLDRVPELAHQQQLLGAGALVPLLYLAAQRR